MLLHSLLFSLLNSSKSHSRPLVNRKGPAKAVSLILAPLVPERAPDENKSVLAAVVRFPLPKTIMLETFSHKT